MSYEYDGGGAVDGEDSSSRGFYKRSIEDGQVEQEALSTGVVRGSPVTSLEEDDPDFLDRFSSRPMGVRVGAVVLYTLWLFCVTFALAGVQFVYSIQFAVGTPLFAQKLKLSNLVTTIILSTAGPISGFVVQPVVGTISDRLTFRFGRRRVFVLLGSLGAACGLVLVGLSASIGHVLGDSEDHPYIGIVLAISGYWVMNISVNVVQGPARALVTDLLPLKRQNLGNAMVSTVMALAAIVANLIGAQFLYTSDPYLWLFLMGAGTVLLTMMPTLIAAREKPYVPPVRLDLGAPKRTAGQRVLDVVSGFPLPLLPIFVAFYCSWAGFSPYMIYVTAYFGQNVYGGDPSDSESDYQKGVQMGMYATAVFALVMFLFSLLMPYLMKPLGERTWGPRVVWSATELVAAACFVLMLFFDELWAAFLLSTVVGVTFATFNSVPFAMAADNIRNDAGLYMGILNAAAVLAQTVTNLGMSTVILHFRTKDGVQDVAWAIAMGGLWCIVAAMAVWLTAIPLNTIFRRNSPSQVLLSTEKQPDEDERIQDPLLR